jgi:hypothetical protein
LESHELRTSIGARRLRRFAIEVAWLGNARDQKQLWADAVVNAAEREEVSVPEAGLFKSAAKRRKRRAP